MNLQDNSRPLTGNVMLLCLATGAFAVCFAIFGSISAMMPIIKGRLGLTPVQVSIAIAVPVLLGSVGRIPLGMLADRFGGRLIFILTMIAPIIPAIVLGWIDSYVGLLVCGRPVGGILADRVGGRRILIGVFPFTALMALLMVFPTMSTFTVGALGMAIAIGLGNGAVFKLVPQFFPQDVACVTGLVGAAGGFGGFFPPLVVGALRQATDHYAWGFLLLALFALGCLVLAVRSGRPIQTTSCAAAPT